MSQENLTVPTMAEMMAQGKQPDVLFWVGCSGSFDDRAKKITKAFDPLSIIMDMRRYLVMEQSAAPTELNNMMTNVENNGAPWQYSQMDRLNWKDEA